MKWKNYWRFTTESGQWLSKSRKKRKKGSDLTMQTTTSTKQILEVRTFKEPSVDAFFFEFILSGFLNYFAFEIKNQKTIKIMKTKRSK